LPALHWRYHQHCAVDFTGIAPASLPASRGHLCPCCAGLVTTFHPYPHKHCKLASAPSRCNRDTSVYMVLSLCSLLSSVVFVAVTGTVPQQLGLHVRPILRWWFFRRCAGLLARVMLGSLQALRCCLCWHCAGIVTNIALASLPLLCWHHPQHCKLASAQPRHSHDTSVCVALLLWSSSLPMASLPYLASFHGDFASDGPADTALVSLPALCWRPWPYCTGIITNIALLTLPALHRHHCPCCMGAFALIKLALLSSSPLQVGEV
jgi:hypothetical protein